MLLQHFSQSPQMKEALEVIIAANDALKLKKPADDARKVMKLNFTA